MFCGQSFETRQEALLRIRFPFNINKLPHPEERPLGASRRVCRNIHKLSARRHGVDLGVGREPARSHLGKAGPVIDDDLERAGCADDQLDVPDSVVPEPVSRTESPGLVVSFPAVLDSNLHGSLPDATRPAYKKTGSPSPVWGAAKSGRAGNLNIVKGRGHTACPSRAA